MLSSLRIPMGFNVHRTGQCPKPLFSYTHTHTKFKKSTHIPSKKHSTYTDKIFTARKSAKGLLLLTNQKSEGRVGMLT
ncbi:hypothetical protein P3342_009634 [Pyrenophora teres f. teres]|nr:hypothetical protein P3342_009634 [Pyrenophora teres f. teres]